MENKIEEEKKTPNAKPDDRNVDGKPVPMDIEENKAKANQVKQLGNDEFKKQNYVKAIQLYSRAIGKYVVCLYLFYE